MRTRLTFWTIFLAPNGAEVRTLSLIHTLGWLGLKDTQGVRFLAAVCSSVVMHSAELHYSCSPLAGRAQHRTGLATEFSIEERSSQSAPLQSPARGTVPAANQQSVSHERDCGDFWLLKCVEIDIKNPSVHEIA